MGIRFRQRFNKKVSDIFRKFYKKKDSMRPKENKWFVRFQAFLNKEEELHTGLVGKNINFNNQHICMIIARVRSGTTVFCRMLNSNPICYAYGEILNPESKINFFQFLIQQIKNRCDKYTPELAIELFKEYITKCCQGIPNKDMVFFDVKYEQTHLVSGSWHYPTDLPLFFNLIKQEKFYVIDIVRKNRLRREISNLLAMQTRQYHLHQNEQQSRGHERKKIYVDPQFLLKRLQSDDIIYESIFNHFLGYKKYLRVYYEDMFELKDGINQFSANFCQSISNFLSIDNNFNINPTLKKITPMEYQETILNYSEIVETLRGTKYEQYLYS